MSHQGYRFGFVTGPEEAPHHVETIEKATRDNVLAFVEESIAELKAAGCKESQAVAKVFRRYDSELKYFKLFGARKGARWYEDQEPTYSAWKKYEREQAEAKADAKAKEKEKKVEKLKS